MQVPGEVLLDQVQAEQVAQPRQDALGARRPRSRLTPSVKASHCSSSACARAASMSSDWCALKSAAASAGDSLDAGRRAAATSATICCTRAGEQLVLLVCAQAQLHRARGRAEVGDRLAELAQAGAVEELARGLRDGEAGEGRGILPLELTGVVGQQPLADQLQQHVVVALERDVDVEVVVQADQAVLGEEAGAAAGLAGLLDRVERVPGRQRLERRREGLEVFALLRGVAAAREHAVELAQQLVVGEELRVVLGEAGAAGGAGACRSRAARPRRCRRRSRTGGAGSRR